MVVLGRNPEVSKEVKYTFHAMEVGPCAEETKEMVQKFGRRPLGTVWLDFYMERPSGFYYYKVMISPQ